MNSYNNSGGNSNITGYENGTIDGSPYIKVQFQDGSEYTYDADSCGAATVLEMQHLALSGSGLNSFISRIRPDYASKS